MVDYTYQIKHFDDNDRKIEITYYTDDGQTRHIESKLPLNGETVEDLVRKYEPLAFWDRPDMQPAGPNHDIKALNTSLAFNVLPILEM